MTDPKSQVQLADELRRGGIALIAEAVADLMLHTAESVDFRFESDGIANWLRELQRRVAAIPPGNVEQPKLSVAERERMAMAERLSELEEAGATGVGAERPIPEWIATGANPAQWKQACMDARDDLRAERLAHDATRSQLSASEARLEDYMRRLDTEKEHSGYVESELSASRARVSELEGLLEAAGCTAGKWRGECDKRDAVVEAAREVSNIWRDCLSRPYAALRSALSALDASPEPAQGEPRYGHAFPGRLAPTEASKPAGACRSYLTCDASSEEPEDHHHKCPMFKEPAPDPLGRKRPSVMGCLSQSELEPATWVPCSMCGKTHRHARGCMRRNEPLPVATEPAPVAEAEPAIVVGSTVRHKASGKETTVVHMFGDRQRYLEVDPPLMLTVSGFGVTGREEVKHLKLEWCELVSNPPTEPSEPSEGGVK